MDEIIVLQREELKGIISHKRDVGIEEFPIYK